MRRWLAEFRALKAGGRRLKSLARRASLLVRPELPSHPDDVGEDLLRGDDLLRAVREEFGDLPATVEPAPDLETDPRWQPGNCFACGRRDWRPGLQRVCNYCHPPPSDPG